MTEQLENRRIFSLLEVTQSVQRTLAERYSSSFWVKAEMNKLNHYPHSGHCYPDLVEKQEGRVIAQLRSVLWKDDYHRINHNFLRVLKTPLKDGIKMLFCAKITFDPIHGLSLRIIDIDPVFSLGELEREKQEAIDRLKSEGIFDRNRKLTLPLLPQRIAVISVQTSKGYADFLKVMESNPYGFKFFHMLFPSLLQGERAVESIIHQLQQVARVQKHFDVVAIIRGGGGEVGLASFNNVSLAREICKFPLPVITGIGHATNETVSEMVAHKNAITPTDLANFLIERFQQSYFPLLQSEQKLLSVLRNRLGQDRRNMLTTAKYFRSVTENVILRHQHVLRASTATILRGTRQQMKKASDSTAEQLVGLQSSIAAFYNLRSSDVDLAEISLKKNLSRNWSQYSQQIDAVARVVRSLDPKNILRRGFTISRADGKLISSVDQVPPTATIETEFVDGKVTSHVKSINKYEREDNV